MNKISTLALTAALGLVAPAAYAQPPAFNHPDVMYECALHKINMAKAEERMGKHETYKEEKNEEHTEKHPHHKHHHKHKHKEHMKKEEPAKKEETKSDMMTK